MPLLSRPDGRPVPKPPMLRRFMPYLMPGRNEAVVYLDQTLRMDHTLAWLAEQQQADPAAAPKLYDLVLAALAQVLSERPQLNRFVVGRRLYQRDDIALSFAVKKRYEDSAPLTTVKVRVAPDAGLAAVSRAVRDAVGTGKAEARTTSEQEMAVVTALPGPLLRLTLWAQRVLDGWNLLPAAMIRNDPLYASVFIANLGSIGLDAPLHHLFEYGTVPLFVTIGKLHKAPVVVEEPGQRDRIEVGQVMQLRYSYDERIADGFYCASAVARVAELLERPELLAC